ncbi:hypothetical protein [Candidatus Magnetaquicoccus inordinatus]|uniref:hypothetical protein n=1 Tax=Candidatus Magnetaquicoccus inordinatus TaxID=2496818 RepID=UPI00102B98A9|nr:hypothetical protein [Candidatus Magnetaquicoccus inordinatus]
MHSETPSFAKRLSGRFDGMIRQEDAQRLAHTIANLDGWYLVEPHTDPPAQTVDGPTASRHLEQLLEEILREESGVWSTMVYVQNQEDPWIVKVFHPRRAGCGCGGQGGIVPWWVLSRIKPEQIAEWQPASCRTADKPTKGALWKKWLSP